MVTCERTMAYPYFHRAYAARDLMRWSIASVGCVDVGHPEGGYCLDAVAPPSGGHAVGDFVYRGHHAHA